MRFPTIRIEGAILSAELLDQLESGAAPGQKPVDFGLPPGKPVKDEILRAWADANDYWRIFRRRLDALPEGQTATTETRRQWLLPLLGLLGYDAQPLATAPTAADKKFLISHADARRTGLPLHLVSARDDLDTRPDGRTGRRPTPHGLVQEYLNLTEHLYGLVSNGLRLRLLRDSSRLVKLSYVEFDLERLFTEGHFADFALLWRLLHASRLPAAEGAGAESWIERYHQDALDAGARIRERLSTAVYQSLLAFGNGFLQHPANEALRTDLESGQLTPAAYHQHLLRLIYRLLFLLVTEERDLLFPETADPAHRAIYDQYYSLQKLRRLCENPYLPADSKTFHDLWAGLRQTFRLFESGQAGKPLGLAPLAGDLFSRAALGPLADADLRNEVLLDCLRNLARFYDPTTRQHTRVNYGALDVEEFGSVYEGLLEFDAVVSAPTHATPWRYALTAGNARAASGSHYTPEALVQPLLRHSLDLLIQEKLREAAEKVRPAAKNRGVLTDADTNALQSAQTQALLSLRIADVACGSGHMLLSAARRLAAELARVQTGQEQPAPQALRAAQRQVISQCLYGTDYNPLAVELCKVALWLEAHNPGEPLDFLDHHIRCGNAIVGLARPEDLARGIATEAFAALKADDKATASALRQRNKQERATAAQTTFEFGSAPVPDVRDLGAAYERLRQMPDHTAAEVEAKSAAYQALRQQASTFRLHQLADLQVAPFFLPKTPATARLLLTDADYRRYLRGTQALQTEATALAVATGAERRFFHWFLEFPDVMVGCNGFDCIIGNPPFLGGQHISGTYGPEYLNWLKQEFHPAGSVDVVTYFFRRNFRLLRPGGVLSMISTNTLAQGNARDGGLGYMIDQEGARIHYAVRSMKWPGRAAVEIALVSLQKPPLTNLTCELDGQRVEMITSYLDDGQSGNADPYPLEANAGKSFQGSIVLGKGFVLTPQQAKDLIVQNPKNAEVLQPYLNGEDLNSRPDQSPSRWVINFRDWPLRRLTEAEWKATDKTERAKIRRRLDDGNVVRTYANRMVGSVISRLI